MSTFRVGLTRDFLDEEGRLLYDIGLDLLDRDPGIEYEFISEFTPEVEPWQIRDYDAVVSLSPRYTARSFEGVERLTAIARFGVGYDMVDLAACTEAGVMCFITPQAVRRPVAVAILTFILALSTKLIVKDGLVRSGRWDDRKKHMGMGLMKKVVGSIGFGGIAQEFFRIAAPLEITGIACDPYASAEQAGQFGVALTDLDTVLRQSDYVCVNCPLTDETHHLIGERELALMKPTAFLINSASATSCKFDLYACAV